MQEEWWAESEPKLAGRGQDYNGYAYVRNGPLCYTDPTGWGVAEEKVVSGQRILKERAHYTLSDVLFVLGGCGRATMNRHPSQVRAFVSLALVTAVICGCKGTISQVGDYECSELIEQQVYYGRPASERLAEIRSYSLDKQYAVFLCGVAYMRPPSWDTAQPFMEQGSLAVDYAKQRLEVGETDAEMSGIFLLIDEMNELGLYKANRDATLMGLLENSILTIGDARLRQDAESRLERLRQSSQSEGANR